MDILLKPLTLKCLKKLSLPPPSFPSIYHVKKKYDYFLTMIQTQPL